MKHRVTLEGTIYFTKMSVLPVFTWPPSGESTKWQLVKIDLALFIANVLALGYLLPQIVTALNNFSDPVIFPQTIVEICGTLMIPAKSVTMRVYRKTCRSLIDELEDFVKNCQAHERQVLEKYVDKCWIVYFIVMLVNYVASMGICIILPFIVETIVPRYTVYRFPIDSWIFIFIIFTHQLIVGCQVSASICVDCQLALIMWFTIARLEILARELSATTDLDNLSDFVLKHNRLLKSANRVSTVMSYTVVAMIYLCGVVLMMCCTFFLADRPFSVRMYYLPSAIIGLTNIVISIWPAESMIGMCELIGTTAYDINWMDASPKVKRNVIMILQRSQRPIKVSVAGLIEALSFRFYTSFLSTVFSFFTTLRAVM